MSPVTLAIVGLLAQAGRTGEMPEDKAVLSGAADAKPAAELDDSGAHFYLGVSGAPGLLVWSAPENGSRLDGYGRATVQLGVLFRKAQIHLEVGAALPMPLYASLSAGALLPLHRADALTVAWVLRSGVATHLSPDGRGPSTFLGLRLDLVGVSVRTARWFFDFQFPSAEVAMLKGIVLTFVIRAAVGFVL